MKKGEEEGGGERSPPLLPSLSPPRGLAGWRRDPGSALVRNPPPSLPFPLPVRRRHSARPPPSPCRGPTLRLPAPPVPGADTHRRATLTRGLRGKRGAGPGRNGTGRAPRSLPARSPPSTLFFFVLCILFSPGVESGWPRLRARRPAPSRGGTAVPSPPFRPPTAARRSRGLPRGGEERREQSSALRAGETKSGEPWPFSSNSGWNSCGRSGRQGGSPGRGLAGCLPDRPRRASGRG